MYHRDSKITNIKGYVIIVNGSMGDIHLTCFKKNFKFNCFRGYMDRF